MGSGGILLGVPRTTLTSLKAARAVGPSVEPKGGGFIHNFKKYPIVTQTHTHH